MQKEKRKDIKPNGIWTRTEGKNWRGNKNKLTCPRVECAFRAYVFRRYACEWVNTGYSTETVCTVWTSRRQTRSRRVSMWGDAQLFRQGIDANDESTKWREMILAMRAEENEWRRRAEKKTGNKSVKSYNFKWPSHTTRHNKIKHNNNNKGWNVNKNLLSALFVWQDSNNSEPQCSGKRNSSNPTIKEFYDDQQEQQRPWQSKQCARNNKYCSQRGSGKACGNELTGKESRRRMSAQWNRNREKRRRIDGMCGLFWMSASCHRHQLLVRCRAERSFRNGSTVLRLLLQHLATRFRR